MDGAFLVSASILLLLLAVFYVRISVGALLAVLGFAGYALVDGLDNALQMLGTEFWATFSSPSLTVIPLFILMGQVAYYSGLCGRLYNSVAAHLGHRRGGFAVASLMACGGFSAICGSNTATAATMSVVALPEMERYGYNKAYAGSVVAAGTTLGAIMPPSVVAIVLAIQTGLPVNQLFVGGILPAAMLLLFFIITSVAVAVKRPLWAPIIAPDAPGLRSRGLKSLGGFAETLTLFLLVILGMSYGIFSPTEAGAAGTFFALVMGMVSRNMTMAALWRAVMDTVRISAVIIFMLAGASAFGRFIVVSGVPSAITSLVSGMDISPLMVLVCILTVYFFGGMFMDALAFLLITLPVFGPLITGVGYDMTWFCILLLVVTSLGAITPPVGAAAFVVSSVGRIPLKEIFTHVLLFVPAFILCVTLMVLFPDLVVWLPRLVSVQ